METVYLFRQVETSESTLGLLTGVKDSAPFTFHTLELPWRDNQTRISRIPAGDYIATWHNSPKFGRCYKLQDVPGRSEILIHHGNYPKNTEGCILIGRSSSKDAVWSSVQARNEFQRLFLPDTIRIRIIEFFA